MQHIFILSETQQQAKDFAKKNNLVPQFWTYLYKPEQLRGKLGLPYIKVGTWYKQENIDELELMLKSREFRELPSVQGRR